MNFESFIAKRYLVSRHKINFISIISMLSVLGITIGVAALIVVLSVFNGFSSLVNSFLISFDPHIRIEAVTVPAQQDKDKILSAVKEIPQIKSYSPFISGKIVAYRKEKTEVINLKGITVESGENIYGIKDNILFGKYDLSNEGMPKAVLGIRLADKLQTIIGDTLTLISPAGIEQVVTQFSSPKIKSYKVAGIYSSNNNEYDAGFIFTSIEAAQDIFNYRNRIQGYDIRLNNVDNAFAVKDIFRQKLPEENYTISTWYDFHRDLYSVMQIERWSAYILLSLIIAVASFNILGSLSMSVIEKKRDIGILRSMGVNQKSVVKIFMYEGILIGVAGTIAGLLLGYFICWLQLEFNIYPLDPTQYKIDSLPLELRLSDFFFVSGMSMLLAFLASLFPSRRAANVNPLEAIKWE